MPRSTSTVFKSVLIISDMHHPFAHQDAVPFLTTLKAKYSFDKVVCIGDEIDAHGLSYHDHDPDLPSAGDEFKLAIKALQPLYALFPQATVVESNHGSLMLRKALTHGMPRRLLKSYNQVLKAPKGWRWLPDLKLQTPSGPVYFCHGKSGAPGRLASQYGMSCCQGHFHEKAQITYISTPERLLFDMHVGCLVNDRSRALAYNKVNPRRPIISVGIILDGVPQIIPMILNKDAKWIGKL